MFSSTDDEDDTLNTSIDHVLVRAKVVSIYDKSNKLTRSIECSF